MIASVASEPSDRQISTEEEPHMAIDIAVERFKNALDRASSEMIDDAEERLSFWYEHPAWKEALANMKRGA